MHLLKIAQSAKILITGGAGFIGSHLVRQLDQAPGIEKIIVVDALTYASDMRRLIGVSKKVELVESNIKDIEKYSSLLSECNFVINLAAESHVDKSISNGTPFLDSNVLGSFILFEACRSINHISLIHISTDEVYGSLNEGVATEMSPLNPTSIYSASKAASDFLALANIKTHRQKITITRCTNNFGPYQNAEKFIPTVINNALQGKSIPIYGDGKNTREWINVADHASAIIKVMNNFEAGKIYNIGSGTRISNIDLAKYILKILGSPVELINFTDDRKGHDYRYAVDSSLIKKELNWRPRYEFYSSIQSTVNWYKSWFEKHGSVY